MVLILKVTNAKLFKHNGDKTTHWVDCPADTFLASSISNVLHVLTGNRPVPTIRKNSLPFASKRISALDEIAKASYVKVVSGISQDEKTGKIEHFPLYGEQSMTRKTNMKSVNKMDYSVDIDSIDYDFLKWYTWERFKYQTSVENFEKITSKIADILDINVDELFKISLPNALKRVFDNDKDSFVDCVNDCDTWRKHWKTLFITGKQVNSDNLRTGYNNSDVSAKHFLTNTVTKGVEKCYIRDAFVYVPVTEEQLQMFENGVGWATILDGGLVTIDSVDDQYEDYFKHPKTHNPEGVSCI